jgi:hypothetical protein
MPSDVRRGYGISTSSCSTWGWGGSIDRLEELRVASKLSSLERRAHGSLRTVWRASRVGYRPRRASRTPGGRRNETRSGPVKSVRLPSFGRRCAGVSKVPSRPVTSRLDVDVMCRGRAPRGRRAAVSPAAPTWPLPATRTAADHPAPASPPVFPATATRHRTRPDALYVLLCGMPTYRASVRMAFRRLHLADGDEIQAGPERQRGIVINCKELAHEGCLVWS